MRAMPWLALLLLLSACESTESSPRVPFKLGSKETPTATQKSENIPSQPSGNHFDSALDHPLLEQKPTTFVGVRSLLGVDLDQDQDRDALALVTDPAQAIALSVAMRGPEAFLAATRVPGFGLTADCEIESAKLSTISATKGLAMISARCGEPKQSVPQRALVFALDEKPFVLERIETVPAVGAATSALSLSFSSSDSDADGHDDVVIELSLSGAGSKPIVERVTLLDRSSALTFDAQAFEIALSVRAERAKELLRKAPLDAENEAGAVIALWTNVCRSADQPSLRLSGTPGLPCLPSRATASARATWIAAKSTRGQLREAVDAYVALSVLEPAAAKAALGEASKALLRMKPSVAATLTPGPELQSAGDPSTRLPSARFVTETLLLLQRDSPVVLDLTTQTESPAPSVSAKTLDPGATLTLSAIERRCAGICLRVERFSADIPSVVSLVSSPVLLPRAAAPDCVDTPQSVRRDAAGFRVLGWAPQGLLLARGSEVRLAPLSIDGKPAGETRILDASTPRPAPLPAGRATADASRYAWLTPFGIVVFAGQNAAPELWRPAGWDAIAAAASDVAISPSGEQLAVLSGGRCYLLKRPPKAQ